MVVAEQMQRAMRDQMTGVIGQGFAISSGFGGAGLKPQHHIAQHLRLSAQKRHVSAGGE